MKKVLCLLMFFVLTSVTTNCKKYEEGPSFTLLSKKSRVDNTWKLDKYYENSVDKTSDALNVFKDFTLVMDKNNMKYSKSFTALGILPYGESGSWKFSSDMNSILFTPDNSSIVPYSWNIIKLKNKSMGYAYTTNNVNVKLYLK
jgi:hypothetical protein